MLVTLTYNDKIKQKALFFNDNEEVQPPVLLIERTGANGNPNYLKFKTSTLVLLR